MGERGPFQMRRVCFDQVSEDGEQFWKLEKDMNYAQDLTERYLLYLYNGPAHKNWNVAVGMYNTGPSNYDRFYKSAINYYNHVKRNGN